MSASYRRPPATQSPARLVRAFGVSEYGERIVSRTSREHWRSRLARVLFGLLDRARINRVEPGRFRSMVEQFAAVRLAAEAIELEANTCVARFLCTYPPALPDFLSRIENAPAWRFRETRRPHGLLLGVARTAARGRVEPVRGEPFAVAGEIKVFGETDGHAGGRSESIGARAPYLMACLIGRPHPDEPVQVLLAYLHPCYSENWIIPVGSSYERRTLQQLLSLLRWFAGQGDRSISIEKPVFDLSPAGGDGASHQLIIPDFIVRGAHGPVAVVETMGYERPAYRARKVRTHAAMSRLCGNAAVVEHDFCLPREMSQTDRDAVFWHACRAAIVASEPGAVEGAAAHA